MSFQVYKIRVYKIPECASGNQAIKDAIYCFFIILLIIDEYFNRYQHRTQQEIIYSGALVNFKKTQKKKKKNFKTKKNMKEQKKKKKNEIKKKNY